MNISKLLITMATSFPKNSQALFMLSFHSLIFMIISYLCRTQKIVGKLKTKRNARSCISKFNLNFIKVIINSSKGDSQAIFDDSDGAITQIICSFSNWMNLLQVSDSCSTVSFLNVAVWNTISQEVQEESKKQLLNMTFAYSMYQTKCLFTHLDEVSRTQANIHVIIKGVSLCLYSSRSWPPQLWNQVLNYFRKIIVLAINNH